MNLATESAYGEPLDVGRLVRPIRWKLGINAALVRILRGAAFTLTAIAIVTVLAHYVTLPGSNGRGGAGPWLLIVSVSGAIATIGFAVRSRPSSVEAIRIADRNLGLKDRLTTAYEYASDDSPMMTLQRHELRTAIREKRMAQAIALKPPLLEVGLLVLAVVLTIAAARAPDPQATSAAARTRNHRITAFAAASVKGLIARLPNDTLASPSNQAATSAPSQTPVVKILQDLAKKLQATDNQRTALKAIAGALAQTRQNAAASARDRAQLQAISQGLSGGATSALSGALRAGDSTASKAALQKLQITIGALTPAQRSALAQSLERAANAAAPSIKQTLRKAAFALGDHDTSTARQALTDLTKQIAAAQTSASSAVTANKTAQQLAAIQQNVANAVSRTQAQPGAGKRPGALSSTPAKTAPRNATASAGKTASQPRTTGNGRTISGNANGKQSVGSTISNSSNAGSPRSAIAAISGTTRSGNGSGQGHSGSGRGSGASGTGNAGARGHVETVYLPGKRSSGPGITEDGPLGSSIAVTSPSYQRVVAQYTTAANIALDRVALPPALQGAIKRYFSALQK